MKRAFQVLGMALVMLLWLAGAKAQADLIQWSASGTPLGPNLSTADVPRATIFPQNGVDGGNISLFPGNATNGTNSGSVVAIYVGAAADPDRISTPTFGGTSANYALSLALHDDESGASGSLTFRGNLSGEITPGNSVYLTNSFLGSTTQTLKLGNDLYTVSIGPFVSPSSLDPSQLGSISASISVQPLTNSTPEPSSLLLACLGLPSLGLAGWFRRRRIGTGAAMKEPSQG